MATIGARGAVRGGVQVMADATTNAPSAQNASKSWGNLIDFSKPATWAWLYFLVAMGYLAFMYFGHGGTRGSVF
jgi:hypothetical protein